jgi:hypothetical protein
MACERPQEFGRSLSSWDCQELAAQLVAEAIVPSISVETVRRILASHHLKPWRYRLWLSPKVPRDEAFAAAVAEIRDLDTRPLAEDQLAAAPPQLADLGGPAREAGPR